MPNSIEQIIQAALELGEEDRSLVAGEILDSLDQLPGLAADGNDLHAELERRSAETRGSVTWESLRDEPQGPA